MVMIEMRGIYQMRLYEGININCMANVLQNRATPSLHFGCLSLALVCD